MPHSGVCWGSKVDMVLLQALAPLALGLAELVGAHPPPSTHWLFLHLLDRAQSLRLDAVNADEGCLSTSPMLSRESSARARKGSCSSRTLGAWALRQMATEGCKGEEQGDLGSLKWS